jgi:hypothetical protein
MVLYRIGTLDYWIFYWGAFLVQNQDLALFQEGWLKDLDPKKVRHTGETQWGERKGRHIEQML